jgi:hypothetical protein
MVKKKSNYALKYNFVYCSEINHGIQKIFQYPGLVSYHSHVIVSHAA